MKKMISFAVLAITQLAFGQFAPVDVLVLNGNAQPISNDKVTFVGTRSKKILVGITNGSGRFTIELPPDETYEIKIDALVDDIEYNTLTIPALPEGASFQKAELEIMYEQSVSFTLSNLHFESGRSYILPKSFKELDHLVAYMKRKVDVKIKVAGHTDNEGDPLSNKSLSDKRAVAVKNYLIAKGISANRIQPVGFGEEQPIASNFTTEGRALNRRTEIEIMTK